MTHENEIKKLRDKIRELEEEESELRIKEFSYLIGTCIHRAITSWEKITKINRVEWDEYLGNEINFDCISISFDERENGHHNRDCNISLDSYGQTSIKDIERNTITNEKFLSVLDKACNFIKEKSQ